MGLCVSRKWMARVSHWLCRWATRCCPRLQWCQRKCRISWEELERFEKKKNTDTVLAFQTCSRSHIYTYNLNITWGREESECLSLERKMDKTWKSKATVCFGKYKQVNIHSIQCSICSMFHSNVINLFIVERNYYIYIFLLFFDIKNPLFWVVADKFSIKIENSSICHHSCVDGGVGDIF